MLSTERVIGEGGHDTLDASGVKGAAVSLVGGEGNDCLVGGTGNDNLVGGNGDDTLVSTTGGNDFLEGEGGNDLIRGDPNSTLTGCGGDNVDCGVNSCTVTLERSTEASASVLGVDARPVALGELDAVVRRALVVARSSPTHPDGAPGASLRPSG